MANLYGADKEHVKQAWQGEKNKRYQAGDVAARNGTADGGQMAATPARGR